MKRNRSLVNSNPPWFTMIPCLVTNDAFNPFLAWTCILTPKVIKTPFSDFVLLFWIAWRYSISLFHSQDSENIRNLHDVSTRHSQLICNVILFLLCLFILYHLQFKIVLFSRVSFLDFSLLLGTELRLLWKLNSLFSDAVRKSLESILSNPYKFFRYPLSGTKELNFSFR